MKNALLIVSVLFVAIISTACINNFAVQELNNKAEELLAKGDYAAAIGRLEASIDIDPAIFETNYNLGIAYIKAEDYEKAVNALLNAVNLKSDQPDVYYSLSVAQYNFAEQVMEGENNTAADDNENLELMTSKELSEDEINKALELYINAADSLEKYLTFSVDENGKSSANLQLETIKTKVAGLQSKLPQNKILTPIES